MDPDPPDVGSMDCDALVRRVKACDGMSREEKQGFADSAAIWRKEGEAGPSARAAAAEDCREMERSMNDSLLRLGC